METGEGDQGDSELSEVGVELIGKAEAASNTGESRGDQVVKAFPVLCFGRLADR